MNAYFARESEEWNKIYKKEDVFSVIHQDRRTIALRIFEELALPRDARILDIGCGAGLTTVDLAQRGYSVEAVDSVPAMIDLARQNAVRFGVEQQVHSQIMDVHHLIFTDQSFDLVIALGVAPWLADLPTALQEIARVLAPGGSLLMTVDNRYRLNHLFDPVEFPAFAGLKERLRLWLEKTGRRKVSTDPRPKRLTAGEFGHLLAAVGLVKMKQRMFGYGPFTLLRMPLFPGATGVRLHRWLQNAADQGVPILRDTGTQYLVLARKQEYI